MKSARFSDEIREFVETTPWTWAKTYADTWPHHYIVRDRVDEELFVKMVQHIRRFDRFLLFYFLMRLLAAAHTGAFESR